MDWALVNHSTGFAYNIKTITFCRFAWSQSWQGLRTMTQKINNRKDGSWWDNDTAFERADRTSVYNIPSLSRTATTKLAPTVGEYLIDLSVGNPLYSFMEMTGQVYHAWRTNIGAAPYQSKVNFSDLVDINLVKQVTLSAGSPALQQLLDTMMTYALRAERSGSSLTYQLRRMGLHRGLWNKDLHPFDAPYTRTDHPLIPFVLLDQTQMADIPSLISNTNVFLHDLGFAGYSELDNGPTLNSGMVRTIYTDMVNRDGTVYCHAITSPTESYNYKVLGSADTEHSLVSSVTTGNLGSLSEFLPGFLYHSTYTQQNGLSEQGFPYSWLPNPVDGDPLLTLATDGNGDEAFPQVFEYPLRPDFLGTTLRLERVDKFREIPAALLQDGKFFVETSGQLTVSQGTQIAGHPYYEVPSGSTLVPGYAIVDGNLITIKSEVMQLDISGTLTPKTVIVVDGKCRQIPDVVVFHKTVAGASGHTDSPAAEMASRDDLKFAPLTEMNLDVIGAISGLSRMNVDASLFYHSRKPRFAFICPDTVSIEMQLLSQHLHRTGNQRIVGPTSYGVEYGSDGMLMNSIREVFSIVGSGEVLKGTPASTTTSSDVVSSDGDDAAEVSEEDYNSESNDDDEN
jgi:hypothetical protein